MNKKISLRDQLDANQKALEGLCRMAGKPAPPPAIVMKPKRVYASKPKSETDTSEDAVMREVAEVIQKHPSILFSVRQNSGSAEMGGRPVWFWKWLRRNGVEMTITDIWGMLTDGRMFAIEVKERNWKGVGSGDTAKATRERRQEAFINVVISRGGVGGFVTCAEDAIKCLSK